MANNGFLLENHGIIFIKVNCSTKNILQTAQLMLSSLIKNQSPKKNCKCMNMFIKMITKTFYWKIVTVLSNINACLSSFNSQHGGGADLE